MVKYVRGLLLLKKAAHLKYKSPSGVPAEANAVFLMALYVQDIPKCPSAPSLLQHVG